MKAVVAILFLVVSLPAAAMEPQEIFSGVRKGDLAAVKALVERDPGLLEARDGGGRTLLHYAAAGDQAEAIHWLVERGVSLEARDPAQWTALHFAAATDSGAAAKALLKHGAALEARDGHQRTSLILCARERGQAATARVLIEAGAEVNAKDGSGSDALELAAWRGKADLVDLLLGNGARVPESGEKWSQGLRTAAAEGLETLFQRLAGKVSDLRARGGEGLLHSAARGGSAAILSQLLAAGYSPSAADRYGWTPLHYAALDGRAAAVRLLVEKGAPVNARTPIGQNAYDIALERGYPAAAAALEQRGAERSGPRFPTLKGDYLGQKPPAAGAELFGLGTVTSIWGLHSPAVFSPGGNEVYWKPMVAFPGETYSRGTLLTMKRVEGRWTAPASASFSGPETGDDVPFFSAGGKRIYFISRRPAPGEAQGGAERIWFADRTGTGWSEPKLLGLDTAGFNLHWQFSLDGEGNVYFGGQGVDTRGGADLYIARLRDGRYEKPVNLGDPFSSPANEDCPFIAPDGSYLLFTRQFDVWVAFRAPDGSWNAPVQLGPEVNSPAIEVSPQMTPDGKYLFFLSQRDGESHPYWAPASVIERARPKRTGARTGSADDRR